MSVRFKHNPRAPKNLPDGEGHQTCRGFHVFVVSFRRRPRLGIMAVAATRKQPVDLISALATNFLWKSGSEKLLCFADGVFPTPSGKVELSRLVKLVGLPGSLADLIEETPRVFNCFFLARGVEEGVAADNLFRLGERAVGDRDLAVGSFVHANACGAKGHALAFDQPPRLHALYYELVHGCHLGLCRQATSWIVRTNADEAHVHSP